jgi:SNF2 family DNA or RNA helicase
MTDKREPKSLDQILKEQRNAALAKRRATQLTKVTQDAPDSEAQGQAPAHSLKGYLRGTGSDDIAFTEHLRPYQRQAVLMMVRNKKTGTHTLNASSVGLGKTRTAMSFVHTMKFKSVLWLTSTTLVPEAVKEGRKIGALVLPTGDNSRLWLNMPLPNPTIIYATNYEKLRVDPYLMDPEAGWDCIIVDECSKLKGGASYTPSLVWRQTKELLHKHFPDAYRLFLSATPAENKPEEIWAALHLLSPEKFDSFSDFRKIFCLYDNKGRMIFSVDKLLGYLGGMVIRQTVENLGLTGMPSLKDPNWFSVETHGLTIDPDSSVGRAYLQMYEDGLAFLDAQGLHTLTPKIMLEVMLRLRQLLSAGPKFTYSKTWHSQYLDEDGELALKKHKDTITVDMEPPYTKHDAVEEKIAELQAEGEAVVVFSCFNQPLENLKNALDRTGFYRTGLLTGQTTQQERSRLVSAFQQGELDVLLVNKKAGATGLNLQKSADWAGGARFILHLDRWWNPAIEEQANGRCVRMNSIAPVVAIYFEVENSMDTVMRDIVARKAEDVEQLDSGLLYDSMKRARLG